MEATAGVLSLSDSSRLQKSEYVRMAAGQTCFLARNRYHRGSPMAWKKKEKGGMKE